MNENQQQQQQKNQQQQEEAKDGIDDEQPSSETTTTRMRILQFMSFSSSIESPFWVRYCQEKLETIQLNEEPIQIIPTYSVSDDMKFQCPVNSLVIIPKLPPPPPQQESSSSSSTMSSTTTTRCIPNDRIAMNGLLYGVNTIESFQKINKNEFLHNCFCTQFFGITTSRTDIMNTDDTTDDIVDSRIISSLSSIVLLTYADLKNYKVYYWFGIPALLTKSGKSILVVQQRSSYCTNNKRGGGGQQQQQEEEESYIRNVWTIQQRIELISSIDRMRRHGCKQQELEEEEGTASQRRTTTTTTVTGGMTPYFLYHNAICLPLSKKSYLQMKSSSMKSSSSSSSSEGTNDHSHDDSIIFAFVDPVGGSTSLSSSSSSSSIGTSRQQQQQQQPQPMGWPIRNLIAYLCFHLNLGGKIVRILSYRPKRIRRISSIHNEDTTTTPATAITKTIQQDVEDDSSILLHVRIPTRDDYEWETENDKQDATPSDSSTTTSSAALSKYRVVGWELNARSKPGPRSVNLQPLLDTKHLAIQAADLNLKLMKWRMIPNLNISRLQSTRVLLIGAGTLGCNVSRVLLGWGIRKLKIIDYGKVSYSNPVRQSLFTLQDCHDDNDDDNDNENKKKKKTTAAGGGGGGRSKSIAAAQALQTIAADVDSEGIIMSIPMPGHNAEDHNTIRSTVDTLDTLIQECDVVFLLTDTRESRWLPTVIATAYNKILINAALGLDSWLVMRHGGDGGGFQQTPPPSSSITTTNDDDGEDKQQQQQQQSQQQQSQQQQQQVRYGCYFCNDVVAPENSTKNRTLDQQCTVTRPGLAPIASSMAVEMMVSILHHPDGLMAPAPSSGGGGGTGSTNFSPTVSSSSTSSGVGSSPLGVIPHQIRGSIVSYTMMTPAVPAFQYCTACSKPVIRAYQHDKMNLVINTCESIDGTYLENVSGLTTFRNESAGALIDCEDWDDDDEMNE